MWKKKIKFNKLHYLLIAVMLFVSSTVIGLSAGYVFETNAFVQKFYFSEKNPDIFLSGKEGCYDALMADEALTAKMKFCAVDTGRILYDVMKVNGIVKMSFPSVFSCTDYRDVNLVMTVNEGNGKIAPDNGEIWLPNSYCDYENIRLGDTVSFGDKKFTLTTIFLSPVTSSAFVTYYPLFVSREDFISFSDYSIIESIMIRAKSQAQIGSMFKESCNILGDLFGGGATMSNIAATDTLTTNITGNIAIVAAVIMFLVILFVMGITVKNNLVKQLKCIGTYKLMGNENRQIKRIYWTGYLIIGSLAIVLGGLTALPFTHLLCANTVRLLGEFSLSFVSGLTFLVSTVFLILGLCAAIALNLKKIDQIMPVEALSLGAKNGVKKLNKSLIKNARSPLSMAVNEIFMFKRQSISVIGMLSVAVLLCFMFLSMGASLGDVNNNIAAYAYLPNGDCYISNGVNAEVYGKVRQDPKVKSAVLSYLSVTKETIDGKLFTGVSSQYCNDFVKGEMEYIRGRAPKAKNELAVSRQILKLLDKEVGDFIKVETSEGVATKLVVGTFSAIMGNAQTIQNYLPEEEMLEFSGNVNIALQLVISVRLKEGSREDFKMRYEQMFTNLMVEYLYPNTAVVTGTVLKILNPIVVILTIMFMILSLIVVVNMLVMNYFDNRRNYGILKSLGLSTGYIVAKSYLRVLILTAVAIILGIGLGSLIMPPLYFAITGAKAFINSVVINLMLAGILLALVTGASLAFAAPIKKITPKNLMEE